MPAIALIFTQFSVNFKALHMQNTVWMVADGYYDGERGLLIPQSQRNTAYCYVPPGGSFPALKLAGHGDSSTVMLLNG